MIKGSPEIENITLFDSAEIPLYTATQQGTLDWQKASHEQIKNMLKSMHTADPEYTVRVDIVIKDHTEGYLSATISKHVLYQNVFAIMLNSLILLAISIFVFVILLSPFLPAYKDKDNMDQVDLFSPIAKAE